MIKFGTDGWRALMSGDFTDENVKSVADALSRHLKDIEGPVVVGYDNRARSEDFARIAAEAVCASGKKVMLTDRSCPSPVVSYHVKRIKACAGVMITASHNPPEWNGFKIKGPYGGSATPEITKAVESLIGSAPPERSGGSISIFDPRSYYIDDIRKFVDLEAIKKAGLDIFVDPMYGSGSGYLPEILGRDVKITEINHKRDTGFGGINPEPITPNLGKLMELCRSGMKVGLALDGDSDRIGAVGDDGVFINTHQVYVLLLFHLLKNKHAEGSIIKTFNMTKLIDKMAARYSLKMHETPIGFKYICDIMLREKVMLGGEESGGMGFGTHIPERDALLAALYLLELMACEQMPLNEVLDDISKVYGRFYYDRLDLHLDQEQKEKVVKLLEKDTPRSFGGSNVVSVERLDGTKLLLSDGSWILFRASGTEPLLRIYCESYSQESVKKLLSAGKDLSTGA